MTKYARADKALAAYELALFAAVGHNDELTASRLAVLEYDAADACNAAAHDRTVNQVTRDFYARESSWFKAQAA